MYQTTKIPELIDPQATYTTNGQEAWRVLGIMAEFAAATERLRGVRPAVSMFGSARIKPGHPYYAKARAHRAPAVRRRLRRDLRRRPGTDGSREPRRASRASRRRSASTSCCRTRQGGNEFQDVGFDFRYFFARKMMFVRFASAYVVLPGGFGTLDELSECLTLVQTGKSRRIPIILVGGDFWRGLVDWMRDKLVGEGMIGEEDLDLMQVIEEPEAIVEAIFDFYEGARLPADPRRARRRCSTCSRHGGRRA